MVEIEVKSPIVLIFLRLRQLCFSRHLLRCKFQNARLQSIRFKDQQINKRYCFLVFSDHSIVSTKFDKFFCWSPNWTTNSLNVCLCVCYFVYSFHMQFERSVNFEYTYISMYFIRMMKRRIFLRKNVFAFCDGWSSISNINHRQCPTLKKMIELSRNECVCY